MTTFDDRENAFEKKFAHDEELKFKIHARRDKLLGLWVAEKLGKVGDAAEAYAKELVLLDFARHGDTNLLDRVGKDLAAIGHQVTVAALRTQLSQLYDMARQQVMAE